MTQTYFQPYTRASEYRFAQPHILRNRIDRISHELRFALPAKVPATIPTPAPKTECRAIVPYEPPCLAIVAYQPPKPKPPKIIPYPVAVGRKSPILPYPKNTDFVGLASMPTAKTARKQRLSTFAEAIRNPNLTVDDLCALSDQHLAQTAREIYYGA